MFKIKKTIPVIYEPEINEIVQEGITSLICVQQTEGMSASGSFCHDCYFLFVYPDQGHLVAGCNLDYSVRFICSGDNRKDKTNIIFEKMKGK